MIRNLKISIILNLLMSLLFLITSFYLFFDRNIIFSSIILFLIGLMFFINIGVKFNITNRTLARFFDAIEYGDDAIKFGIQKKSSTLKSLENSLIRVKNKFIEEKFEKEKSLDFLHFIINNINIDIIVYDSFSYYIKFCNRNASKIFLFQNDNLELSKTNKEVISLIKSMDPNSEEQTKIYKNQFPVLSKLAKKEIISESNKYYLIVIEEIENSKNETEEKAWESLIRVLTHEIMNSMTPISSLADTVKSIINEIDLTKADLNDANEALETIRNRSIGLKNFVKSYRNIALLPEPNFEEISVNQLIENAKSLLKNEFNSVGVNLNYKIEINSIIVDKSLIEQVLVNLLINSIDSLRQMKTKEINIIAKYNNIKNPEIIIEDTGYGIEKESLEKIFVPFYTTKRSGSGIGLNLCKQIMKLHKGNIEIESEIMKGTKVTLTF